MGYTEYLAAVAADSPAASWSHLETSGTSLADATGNGRTATTSGSPALNQTSTIPGYDGPVILMDGSNDQISVADHASLEAVDANGFTFSRWLKMDAAGAGDVLYVIGDKTGLSKSNSQWSVFWDNRTSQGSPLALKVQWGNATVTPVMTWAGTVARDALLAGGLLTVVFQGNSIGFIYWNGVQVASLALTNFPGNAGNAANARALELGYNSSSGFRFKGEFGPGAVWGSALAAHRVRAHYASATGAPVVAVTRTIATTKIHDSSTYDAFPGVVKCPNGDLLAVFTRNTAHTTSTSSYGLYATRSTDGGATWGTPAKIVSNDATNAYMSSALSVVGSDVALVTWRKPLSGGVPLTDATRIFLSTDSGATWGSEIVVDTGSTLAYYALSESPLVLHSDGYYYLAVWGQETSTANDCSAAIIRSTDLATWSTVATFDTGGISGYNETAVVALGSTLVALIRKESDGHTYTSTSTNGTTWSSPALAKTFARSAPRTSPEGPGGYAYAMLRYAIGSASSGAYLAEVDSTGAVREVEPLAQALPFMYGQVAVVDDSTIVGVWAAEQAVSPTTDADVYAAKWTLTGFNTPVTVSVPVLAGTSDLLEPTVVPGSAVTVAAPVLAGVGDLLVPSVVMGTSILVAVPTIAGAGDLLEPSVVAGSSVVVAAPVLAGTGALVAPSVEVSTAIPVFSAPVLTDARWVSSEAMATLPDVTVWAAKVETDARMRLPLVLAAPPLGVLSEWPLTRQAHIMDALSAANPRYTAGVDYDIEYGEVGRPHVLVDGVDVTYLRGVPARFSDYTSSVPFGPASASLGFPQFKPWDELGTGDLSMFTDDARVEIAIARPDDTVEQVWEGFLASDEDNSGENREDYTFHAEGLFAQAMHEPYDPPVYLPPTDPGHLVADVLNSVTHRRWNKIPHTNTGLPKVTDRGRPGQSKWQRAQDLLSKMLTVDGRQWTLARVAPYTYRVQLKATTAVADWTVTKGAPGVECSFVTDQATRRDCVYGRGYAPDGGYWEGRVFPGLEFGIPPRYPMNNTSLNLDGRSDGSTDTGNGITLWQRKMRELGYPVTVDGVMNSADARWVTKIQRDRALTVDGSLGPQTWAATWENNSTEMDLTTYRLPLATLSNVEPYKYSASGARIGANPGDDPTVIRHAMPEVDFGSGIKKSDAIALARIILDREQDPGVQGRITIATDPHEVGASRFDIKPGDNVRVVGHRGGVTFQVSEVSASDLSVTLTVDSKARDALAVQAILERNEEARRDVSSRTGKTTDGSSLNKSAVVQYESESRAGFVPRTAVNGNSGLWTVRKTFVSQIGVAKVEFETSPNAELVVALFNRPIRISVLESLIGAPLASSDGWYDNIEKLQEKYGLMEVFGSDSSPGGYWPRQKGDGPLTGRLRDSSSLLYDSPFGGFVWVAMFTSRSAWVEGRVFPATEQ